MPGKNDIYLTEKFVKICFIGVGERWENGNVKQQFKLYLEKDRNIKHFLFIQGFRLEINKQTKTLLIFYHLHSPVKEARLHHR